MEIVEIDSSLRGKLAQLSPQTSHSIYKVPRHLLDVNNKALEPEIVASKPKLPSLEMRVSQPSPETTHSIYRVPRHLRDVNNKAFEPLIVAIGPYYHGQPEFKRMEEVKLLYMQSLLERKPLVSVKDYILGIKEESKRARNCYEESTINLNDDEFTDMLVLDGCFIIEVIQDGEKSDSLFSRSVPDRSGFRILQRDLILLENQIPFFVLCKLFDLIQGKHSVLTLNEVEKLTKQHSFLMESVLEFCKAVFPGRVSHGGTKMRRSEEVQHILDLIHSNCCPAVQGCRPKSTSSCILIPSASELKGANVKFRKKDYNSKDKIVSLFDVDFDSGQMVMPILEIDDWTESLLRNFIAYEQLLPGRISQVVDYIVLLDCLINTPKDVQILCGANIIENLLGSEEVVMELVNKLGEGVMIDNFMYEDMCRRINKHHKKPWNRAVAALRRDHFNTPWAYIAFLAALTLLLLTAAQTIFSAL